MSLFRSPRARTLLVLGSLILSASAGGCNPSNPNEQEFLRDAPAGKPPDNPNETVSERRARTLSTIKKPSDAASRRKAH